jgi:hypothetical protein
MIANFLLREFLFAIFTGDHALFLIKFANLAYYRLKKLKMFTGSSQDFTKNFDVHRMFTGFSTKLLKF